MFVVQGGIPRETIDSIEWYKDGSLISNTSRFMFRADGLSLYIFPVTGEDQGTYTISIRHSTATVSAQIYLDVQSMLFLLFVCLFVSVCICLFYLCANL